MLTTEAKKFCGALRSGSTRPVLVEDTAGVQRLVRLRHNGSGVRGSINELLAYEMASHFQVLVPDYCLVELKDEFARQVLESEQRGEVERSIGLNLATTYLQSASPARWDQSSEIERWQADTLFLFDLMLMNFDRNERNPDLLQCGGRVLAVDFASSIGVLNPTSVRELTDVMLQQYKRHPCYRTEIATARFHQSRQKISARDVQAVVDKVPQDWLNEIGIPRADVARATNRMIERGNAIDEALRTIDRLPPFDPDARRNVERRNRDRFQERFDAF